MRRRSLRSPPISVRLAGMYAALFLAAIVVLGSVTYWRVGVTVRSRIDQSLVDATAALDDPLGELDLADLVNDPDEPALVGSIAIDERSLPDDDDDADAVLAGLATIERTTAEEAALTAIGGGTVVESELEDVHGYITWEIEVLVPGGESRIFVDAGNGAVLAATNETGPGGLEPTRIEVQLLDSDLSVFAASDELAADRAVLPADALARAAAGEPVFATIRDGNDEFRALAVPVPSHPKAAVAIVAADLAPVAEARSAVLAVLIPVGLLAVVFASTAGLLVARRGLAPVAQMTAQADAIGGADLSRRLSLPSTDDEIARLGHTLNAMLQRLEAAIQRERDFTAEASHELRTPLAILRAEIELAHNEVDEPHLRSALDSALDEADRLGDLIDDLLLLARVEADCVPSGRVPVDLGDLVDSVLERFAVVAKRRRVMLRRTGGAVISADSRALERAVANLVDNALRHSPDGGDIHAEIIAGRRVAQIAINDRGPGIAPAQLERVFERFARAEPASPDRRGVGLGLAIVAAVATAHHGTVHAENRPTGGLRVVLEFPDGHETRGPSASTAPAADR